MNVHLHRSNRDRLLGNPLEQGKAFGLHQAREGGTRQYQTTNRSLPGLLPSEVDGLADP